MTRVLVIGLGDYVAHTGLTKPPATHGLVHLSVAAPTVLTDDDVCISHGGGGTLYQTVKPACPRAARGMAVRAVPAR